MEIGALTGKFKLISFLSLKMFGTGKRSNIVYAILFFSITLGLAALIVVIGVMNGFQNNHISRRIEIGSYHAEITRDSGIMISDGDYLKNVIYQSIPEVEAVVPFIDREVLMVMKKGSSIQKEAVKLRALDEREIKKDTLFNNYFKVKSGINDLSPGKILLGEELGFSYMPYAGIGSQVYLGADMSVSSLVRRGSGVNVGGYFVTGSYDFDRYWVYMSLETFTGSLGGRDELSAIGIKFKKGVNHSRIITILKKQLGGDYRVASSSEINSGYLSALQLEKGLIALLFILIFVLVAVNIYGAIKLSVLERKKEILILKAVGLKPNDTILVFVMEALGVSIAGCLTGFLSGIFISYNIEALFEVIENGINLLLMVALPDIYYRPVKLYDSSIYYQTGFIVKLNLPELIGMFVIIFTIAVLAAVIPILNKARIKPNEILGEDKR